MDGWNASFQLGWPIFRGELLVLGSVYIIQGILLQTPNPQKGGRWIILNIICPKNL